MGCSPHVCLGKFPIQKINEGYDRVVKSDVKCRFVIDMRSLGRVGKV
jgi:D-arabinose 1-dehydrogenase-like Zn-dependent alcohol dehydrogenase